jgi:cysteine desulfurase
MKPYFSEAYGNPSSVHRFGRDAENVVEEARRTMAKIFSCKPKEVVFTSCGSESDNLAIRGLALAAKKAGKGRHIITSPQEHSAVSRTVEQLVDLFDFEATFLPVDENGHISPEVLREAMREDTVLVSLMLANNEIGTILPIRELAEVARKHNALFHTDAVQAAGQLDLDVEALGVDALSVSAHKFYGPKGVGALYVREGLDLVPSQTGGSHEEARRAGTHNVPLIVGMAEALRLADVEQDKWVPHFTALRDRLIEGILGSIPDAELSGSREERLPSHASFMLQNINGNTLLMHLDMKGIAASSGSACKTGNPTPSGVLLAMGYDESWALGGLRLTVGRHTRHDDIDYVLDVLPTIVENVRKFSAVSA